ncbi:MAG TPA: PHB depolymerase family esterase [Solimonas sp.]|nr:PHB depolymerase family esterase [Solimonas sp.]
MRLLRHACACLLLAATGAHAQQPEPAAQVIDGQGYSMFVPSPTAGTPMPMPLLIVLHGSYGKAHAMVAQWAALAERERFIVAGPDARESSAWRLKEDGPEPLFALAERIKAQQPVDPRRVYLFGFSAGARFTLMMSMMESQYFAAAAVFAGAWKQDRESLVTQLARRKLPVALFIGDRDPLFPLESARDTERTLREQGFPVELTILKDHDHDYSAVAREVNAGAWRFLSARSLDAPPRYLRYPL